jgi:hypothetical protein
LEGSGGGLILRYCPSIHLKRLRKTTKTLKQNTRSPEDLNPEPPEYKAGVNHMTTTFGEKKVISDD